MKARKVLGVCRRLTWVLVLVGGFYLWNRYELMRFPSDGCSPLVSLRPGSVLWIDRESQAASVGDVLFYSIPTGQAAIGRCSKLRQSPPAFWIVADNPACPGPDSNSLGWIGLDQIQGRVLLAY